MIKYNGEYYHKKFNFNVKEYVLNKRNINGEKGNNKFIRFYGYNVAKSHEKEVFYDSINYSTIGINENLSNKYCLADDEIEVLKKFKSFSLDNVKLKNYNKIITMSDVLNDFTTNFTDIHKNYSFFINKENFSKFPMPKKVIYRYFRKYIRIIRSLSIYDYSPNIKFFDIGSFIQNMDKCYNLFEKIAWNIIRDEIKNIKSTKYGLLFNIIKKSIYKIR